METPGTEVTLEYSPDRGHHGDSLYCVSSQSGSNHGNDRESHRLVLDVECEYSDKRVCNYTLSYKANMGC